MVNQTKFKRIITFGLPTSVITSRNQSELSIGSDPISRTDKKINQSVFSLPKRLQYLEDNLICDAPNIEVTDQNENNLFPLVLEQLLPNLDQYGLFTLACVCTSVRKYVTSNPVVKTFLIRHRAFFSEFISEKLNELIPKPLEAYPQSIYHVLCVDLLSYHDRERQKIKAKIYEWSVIGAIQRRKEKEEHDAYVRQHMLDEKPSSQHIRYCDDDNFFCVCEGVGFHDPTEKDFMPSKRQRLIDSIWYNEEWEEPIDEFNEEFEDEYDDDDF